MALHEEFKEKWLEALRSGDYHQVSAYLKAFCYISDMDNEFSVGYCCLGVGARLLREEFPELLTEAHCEVRETDGDLAISQPDGYTSSVQWPEDLCRTVGLHPSDMNLLADLNDKGWSFDRLADKIERDL